MKFTLNCVARGKNLNHTPIYCGNVRDPGFCAFDGLSSCASYSCTVVAAPVVASFFRAQTNETAVQRCAAIFGCSVPLNDAAAASALHVDTINDLHVGGSMSAEACVHAYMQPWTCSLCYRMLAGMFV